MLTGTIDTHIHIWDFAKATYEWLKNDTSLLHRSYAIEELTPQLPAAGVTEGVLVQAANNLEDTEWMLHVAAATPWLKGVVGWLPLTNPSATEKLLTKVYQTQLYYKGVRHLIHDEADPRWLLQDTVIESLRILAAHNIPYDVVAVLPEHIETAMAVAERIPQLKMVFDHMSQPPIAGKEQYGRWGSLMQEAAQHPAFYVKISGLGTTARNSQWQAADILPYITFVLEHFGEDRCFCGGDWPVALLGGGYADTWHKYRQALAQVANENVQEKIFYHNAKLFYNL